MTRKMAYIGSAFFIGLLLASFLSFSLSVILAAAFAIVGTAFIFFKRDKAKLFRVCIFTAAIAMLWYGAYGILIYSEITSVSGKTISVDGVVEDYTDYASDVSSYIVSSEISGIPCRLIVYGISGYEAGDRISVVGAASIPENSYTFPARDYYRAKGIFLRIDDAECSYLSGVFSLRRIAADYSDYIGETITEVLPNEEGELMKALVFGDKSGLDADVRTDFGRSGISHVVAVSGFHLSIVTAVLFFFLKPIVPDKRVRFVIAEIFIWAFAFLAELSQSVIRAAIMLTIFMAGELLMRKSDAFNSLGIAVLLLTAAMPFSIRDASLVLSVSGVFGIGVIAPSAINNIKFKGNKIAVKIQKGLLVALICSLTTFPVSILFFDEVSIIFPLGNIVVVPLCIIALVCGVLVALTGGIAFLAYPLLIVGGIFCRLSLFLTDVFADIPFSTISIGYEYIAVIVILSVIAVLLSYVLFRNRRMTAIITALSLMMLFIGNISDYVINKNTLNIAVFGGRYSSVVLSQGDAAVVIAKGGKQQTSAVSKYLTSLGKDKVEVIILTESDAHFAADYNDKLRHFNVNNVIVGDNAAITDGAKILEKTPQTFSPDGMSVNIDNYSVSVVNGNVIIKYGEFSMLCAENSDFFGSEYTVVANYMKEPATVSCGYMLPLGEHPENAGYVITCTEKSETKVVQIENGIRQ